MKLSDLDLNDTEPEEEGGEGLEDDLQEALDLLVTCQNQLEELVRSKHKKRSWMQEKEIEDLAVEISAFLNQWEDQ